MRHFPGDEVDNVMDSIINWERYAEMFNILASCKNTANSFYEQYGISSNI